MLEELPETLDGTYERILRDINKANRGHAHRLLQCLTVAVRPLRVAELAEVLAVDFETVVNGTSKLNTDWRGEDRQQAVLSTCSSLISIVDGDDSQVVQFSHFSVKEFLTSPRLAGSSTDVSRFHIPLEPAHTILAKACLGVLFRLDEDTDGPNVENSSPLAGYAAEHWVDHAQFKKVSSHIREGMEYLFDPDKPYFAAWLWVYDIDTPPPDPSLPLHFGGRFKALDTTTPLYYAALCGFCDLAEHLIMKHPQQVNAKCGYYWSPLAAALTGGHLDVAQLLYEHGADVDVRSYDYDRRTPLYSASGQGHREIVEWLLRRGADPNIRGDSTLLTPLHMAALNGQVDVSRILLQHKTDRNALDVEGQTPFHLASKQGHIRLARLLLEHGVDVNALDNNHSTALHLTSKEGHTDVARWLLGQRLDANAKDSDGRTPLHLASGRGYIDIAQLLLEYGADVNALDNNHFTALHLTSREGHNDAARWLLAQGLDVNAQDSCGRTPLHLAAEEGDFDIAQLLLEHGVDVNALDNNRSTVLHVASKEGHSYFTQWLLEQDLDVDAQDSDGRTPLQLALEHGHVDVTRLLLEHGVDVNAPDNKYSTALHLALGESELEGTPLSLEPGAEPEDDEGRTPLEIAPGQNGVIISYCHNAQYAGRRKTL